MNNVVIDGVTYVPLYKVLENERFGPRCKESSCHYECQKAAVQFPAPGQKFGVRMKNRNDRSYMEDVFECIASDKLRVVAKRLTGRPAMDSYTFHRRDNWIEIISLAVLTAQGFAEECECVRARCHDCCCCV